jgi:hypothetical protein
MVQTLHAVKGTGAQTDGDVISLLLYFQCKEKRQKKSEALVDLFEFCFSRHVVYTRLF